MIPSLLASVMVANQGLNQPVLPDVFKLTLQATGLQFKENESFYEVKFGIAESNPKRSQTAYIRKTTEEYLSLKVKEVYSLVWESPNPPSGEFLLSAFQKRYGVGGLVYEKPSENQKAHRIRYRLTVPTDVEAKKLKFLLDVVAATGDSMEKEFNPGVEDKL